MTRNAHTRPIGAVLFDLDGTLLDTAPDLGAAVNHVLIEEGVTPLSMSAIRHVASDGALGLLRAGLGEQQLELRGAARLRQALLDYYAGHLCVGTRPYPGMTALIDWLNAHGIRLRIVTNKPAFLTEPLMAQLPQLPACGVIVSADTLPVRKPHPEPLLYACRQLQIPAEQCLYVGDHERDITAGVAAGMHTAIAGWGYFHADEDLAAWGADLCFADVPGLHAWLQQRLAR